MMVTNGHFLKKFIIPRSNPLSQSKSEIKERVVNRVNQQSHGYQEYHRQEQIGKEAAPVFFIPCRRRRGREKRRQRQEIPICIEILNKVCSGIDGKHPGNIDKGVIQRRRRKEHPSKHYYNDRIDPSEESGMIQYDLQE